MIYDRVKLLSLVGIILLLEILAGCGGGGGGGGGTSTPETITVTGKVTDSSGNALSGIKVIETPTDISATTGTTGSFQLSLPASTSDTTGTFEYFNTSNQLELETQETINVTAGQTLNIGTAAIGPPAPPVNPG